MRLIKMINSMVVCLSLAAASLNAQTNITVTPANSQAGVENIYQLAFRAGHTITNTQNIRILLPAGFNFSSPVLVSVDGMDGTYTSTVSTQFGQEHLQIDRTSGTDVVPNDSLTIQIGNVVNAQTVGSYTVLISDDGGVARIVSAAFDITHAPLDHFNIANIGTQTAGTNFTLSLEARDAYDNVVTSYTSTANLVDLTGTLSLNQTAAFAAGTASPTLNVTKTMTGNQITVSGGGKSGISNSFDVNPGALDHFIMASVPSPRTAGDNFLLSITAYDVHGNIDDTFAGNVQLSLSSGTTITPNASGLFSNGTINQTVNIPQAQSDVQIQVDDLSGHTGQSNLFNVEAGVLHHFSIASIGVQAPGEPFPITVTARDAQNNVVTAFDGSGNTVDIDHNGSGTLSPATSGTFTRGMWTGNVTISQTQSNDYIIVTRSGGSETGSSNTFNVIPLQVDHFIVSTVAANVTAGTPFSVTFTAKDADGNTVTNFSGTAIVTDETATISPQQINIVNGTYTGQFTLQKVHVGNAITIAAQSKQGTSNSFNVVAGAVASYDIAPVASPQTVGMAFSVTMTAKDAYGNIATGFSGYVNLRELNDAVTVSPATSGSFSNGVRTQNITINQKAENLKLRVYDASSNEGVSNYFNVQAGAVHHFAVQVSGNQIAGDPFTVSVQALDQFDNLATSFVGTVDLSDLTGTIEPDRSGNFTLGQWTGNVTVTQSYTNDRITVVRTSGSETGQSGTFDLVDPPAIRIVYTEMSQATATAGQTRDWTIKVALQNLSSYDATLESSDIDFTLAGQDQNDYSTVLPGVFFDSGTATLAGGDTDTLEITVSETGASTGAVHITPVFNCRDSNTGRIVRVQPALGVLVQSPAVLDIVRTVTTQDSATIGQGQIWRVHMVMQNTGQSTLRIDSAAVDNALSFGLGSSWLATRPLSLAGGGWEMAGGSVDTLSFVINRTGSGQTGTCSIDGTLQATELNSLRTFTETTADHGQGSIWLEGSPNLRIDGIKSLAPNGAYVNQSQRFLMRVYVKNLQADDPVDGIGSVQVSLSSNGFSAFPSGSTGLIGHLAGGERDSVDILVQAAPSSNPLEPFKATASGIEDNTNSLVNSQQVDPLLDQFRLTIQQPANVVISQMLLSDASVVAGQVDPWTVNVVVVNTGGAALTLNTPTVNDVKFFYGGVRQLDYIVSPPDELSKGGLVLNPGVQDTLKYEILTTGRLGGTIDVQGSVNGVDANTLVAQSRSSTSSISVQSETEFRIIQTFVRSPNRSDAGNGFVNTSQYFEIVVKVENGLGQSVRDIQIDLTHNGQSSLAQTRRTINDLAPQAQDSVVFQITSASTVNAAGETFTASIAGGTLVNSNTEAPKGPALDATAIAYIQSPAVLSLSVSTMPDGGQVSVEQSFAVSAMLTNGGQGQVDESGQIKIVLPEGYTLDPSENDIKSITVNTPVTWQVKAPVMAHANARTIYILQEVVPTALNTGLPALMNEPTVSVEIQTVANSLSCLLNIASPNGAVDGVLSTSQSFVLRALVIAENVDDVEVELSLPAGYSTAENLIKAVNTQDVFWQIQCPSTPASQRNIQISVRGTDSFQPGRDIQGQGDIQTVTTVARADLRMTLETSDNSVSLGQDFVVTARINNLGTALTAGTVAARLNALPAGYQTADAAEQIFENSMAQWTIKAPIQPTQDAVSIVAQLTTLPIDVNTSQTAYVSQGQDKVAMTTVGAWLSVALLPRPVGLDGLVAPGEENIWLGGYEFVNRGELGANGVVFEALRFHAETPLGEDIEPNALLSGLRVVAMERVGGQWVPDYETVYASRSGTSIGATNPVTMTFTRSLMVSAQDTVRLALVGDIQNTDLDTGFLLNLRSKEDIQAKDQYSTALDILVYDNTGAEFNDMISFAFQVVGGNGALDINEVTVLPCPNPFGMAGKEETNLVYTLPKTESITFTIFTLTGEVVWQRQYDEIDAQAAAGLHGQGSDGVTWDGRNGNGDRVLSGVYICYLKTASGEVATTKLAVIY